MSDYYDLNKPYTIPDWNLLVQDVNEILQGPPSGASNCPPVDPLEEVEDPHLWAVGDITTMRDRLKETCPDISFSEELVLWKNAIIDEIESEMEKAWCDCETEPDEEDIVVCTHNQTAAQAAATSEWCCGNVVESASCLTACLGSHCRETQYQGVWYPSPGPDNLPKYNIACDSYDVAYFAVFNLLSAFNKLPALGQSMESYQNLIDSNVIQIDALIEQYQTECLGEDPVPPQCSQITADICSKGTQANSWQTLLDEKLTEFQNWYSIGFPLIEEANAAAAQNEVAILGLTGRFPSDHNVTEECFADAIPSWAWYDNWDPSSGDKLGDTFDHFIHSASAPGNGVLVHVIGYRINSNSPSNHRNIAKFRLSPNGTWYMRGGHAKAFNRDYTHTYYDRRIRWRCETDCEPIPGKCEWLEWSDFETIWWSQGWPAESSCVGSCLGFACFIWSPLPEPDLPSFGEDEFHRYQKRQSGLTDVSTERDEWLNVHNNWHNFHEPYDDRHNSYC